MAERNRPDVATFNRAMDEETEQVGIALWKLLFPRIDEIRAKLDGPYVGVVEPRSSLKLDDAYLGQWRGGGMHVGAMNAAGDALRTIKRLLELGEVPTSALYPMLRAAIENAALAVYLLAPEERNERLRRMYQLADDDAQKQCAFSTNLQDSGAAARRTRVRVHILRQIALRPSLGEPRQFRFGMASHTRVVGLADDAADLDPLVRNDGRMPLVAWWQLLSGMSHAKQWAMIAALDRRADFVDAEDESAQIYMTSSTAVVGLALQRAVETLEVALRLFGRRSKAAWAQPEDASEPRQMSIAARRAQMS